MTPSDDLTDQACEGFEAKPGERCPYLYSSNTSAAWHIGRWLSEQGGEKPRGVRASRGYTYHVNGFKVRIDWYNKAEIRRV
jgi:hypothetical protein